MFGRYELREQLGVGRDGVRFRAFDPETRNEVDLIALSCLDADPARLKDRDKRLRSAALLTHASARKVLELRLQQPNPFVVLEPAADETSAMAPKPGRESVSQALDLASGLSEAHRLGLVHGDLGAGTLAGPSDHQKIDWTGLDLGAVSGSDRESELLPPEQRRGERPGPASDVFSLGTLILGRITGQSPRSRDDATLGDTPALEALIRSMRHDDPAERPSARQVVERLTALLEATVRVGSGSTAATLRAETTNLDLSCSGTIGTSGSGNPGRDRLGRFLLLEKLGEGGMGTVYRGEDLADGSTVAIKVLLESWARQPLALRRFSKEARLLAEVNNPYVTHFIELNEDDGIHYLVLEYVPGTSLARRMRRRGPLDEPTALAIMADVARGLAVAHDRGIVHRDIKPENILLIEAEAEADPMDGLPDALAVTVEAPARGSLPRVKLSDFGVARQVDQSESLSLTQDGSILGTPLYMAPEQCAGSEAVGPAADVYALGATLFHMLAGRTPFESSSTLGLIAKHQNEPPPSLKEINGSLSDGVAQVVAKALAKRPEGRYADAGEMLLDLERLLRGEPTGIGVHPKLPECDPRDLVRFDFRWDLEAEPWQLWPLVSNTERLNRALGLPAIPFTTVYDPVDGVRRYGRLTSAGLAMRWREQPYEWVEGRRMGVVREFSSGPFRWFVSIVELTPKAGGGTLLTHGIRVAVKGWIGRAVAHLKIGKSGRRSMDRVYRRIDAALKGKLDVDAGPDPFEPPAALSHDRRRRLDRWLEALGRHGIDPLVIERIGDHLALASPQEVARIRPLALARRLDLEADQVLSACLHGAKDGALILLWDILCPVCRIPSQVVDTLRALREHGRCEACHADFELDFANSVEMIFRVHPEIRESETGVYCIGGPAHSPHVVAQVRVGPGERFVLDLELSEGAYQLRGPQLGFSVDFRVEPAAPVKRWDISLSRGTDPDLPRTLRTGGQTIALTNDNDRELLVRIERTAPRDDALTAADASALALFRDLFPGEVLLPGQLINLTIVTLVVAELVQGDELYEEAGDSRAFALIQSRLGLLDALLRRHGGAPVKTVDERTVSVFPEPLPAVRAALDLTSVPVEEDPARDLKVRVGVHRGPALVATRDGHLDYFGTTPRVAARLSRLAPAGTVVFSHAVAADPGVSTWLCSQPFTATIIPATIPGLPEGYMHRISRPETCRAPDDSDGGT